MTELSFWNLPFPIFFDLVGADQLRRNIGLRGASKQLKEVQPQ
jgi:hypothetical protein